MIARITMILMLEILKRIKAMKIIEYGHIKPKEVKCSHCGAILEYVPMDLEYWGDHRYFLRCPVCRGNITSDNDGKAFER